MDQRIQEGKKLKPQFDYGVSDYILVSNNISEHYGPLRTVLRKILEHEQNLMLQEGKSIPEIMTSTEAMLTPIVNSRTIQNEPIYDSKKAKDLKKQLDGMRRQGLIEGRPIKSITTTTTTIEFEDDNVAPRDLDTSAAPPAYTQ